MLLLILINTAIFFALALLHFYWALGGISGIDSVIPIDENNELTFRPPPFITAMVGLGLVGFGLVMLGHLSLFQDWIPTAWITYASYVIAIIFLLRALGDFKYCGFFKRVNDTKFAKNDTLYYTPLCLYLGVSILLLVFIW